MRYITLADKIVIVSIIVISIAISIFFVAETKGTGELYVKIESCGEEYAVYPLNNFEKTIEIDTKFGYNEIKIYNGNVWVSKSDCNDKLEMLEGHISNEGQMLICMPNRLVVSIVSDDIRVDGVTY